MFLTFFSCHTARIDDARGAEYLFPWQGLMNTITYLVIERLGLEYGSSPTDGGDMQVVQLRDERIYKCAAVSEEP